MQKNSQKSRLTIAEFELLREQERRDIQSEIILGRNYYFELYHK